MITEGTPSKAPSKAKNETARKQSQQTASLHSNNDELQHHFNTNHYALFTLSLMSKSICLASSVISKLQPFERIIQISQNVKTLLIEPNLHQIYNKFQYFF